VTTTLEKVAQRHAADWLRYSRSPQAQRDLRRERDERARADRAAGHLPACTLSRCAPGCPKGT
jgi:hypothetical protein